MKSLFQWMKEEIIRVIPAVIYFAIMFNLIYFSYGLTLKAGTVRHFTALTVTLGALVVGKVLIMANYLPFINAFPKKPLIYNITWKFLIYSSLVILCWVLENMGHFIYQYGYSPLVFDHIKHEILTGLFWASVLWLMIAFLFFTIFSEFASSLGSEKVKKLLFG